LAKVVFTNGSAGQTSPAETKTPPPGNLEDTYFASVHCCTNNSPTIIDLQHSGFRLTEATDSVYFDFSGTGQPILVSRLAPNSGDAWLALDRNGNC
jgi:hypothetical protein